MQDVTGVRGRVEGMDDIGDLQLVAHLGHGDVAGECAIAPLVDESGAKIGEVLVAGDLMRVTVADPATTERVRELLRAASVPVSIGGSVREVKQP